MYAATAGPNMKCGHRFQMGCRPPLAPRQATALCRISIQSRYFCVLLNVFNLRQVPILCHFCLFFKLCFWCF